MNCPLGDNSEANTTKQKILLEAAILFARRGYSAVTMRDIACQVQIRAGSIYNHFESKDALYEAILENMRRQYMGFYDRLGDEIEGAASFEEVLDGLLAELNGIYQLFVFYGVSLITTEQYRNQMASELFNSVYLRRGIEHCNNRFLQCIEKNWVKPFDTWSLAVLLMNSVMVDSLMRAHEEMGQQPAYSPAETIASIRRLLLSAVESVDSAEAPIH